MSILAMAPPLPVGGKLFVAVLMLALAGVLLRMIRGGPFTRKSIGLAVAASVVTVVLLEAALPSSYGGGFHDRGVLAAVAGTLSSILLRPVPQSTERRRCYRPLVLSALAFASGPVIGLLLATLTVLLSDVPPMDRAYTFGVFTLIGTFAGVIGAILVAAVALCGTSHSSKNGEEKQESKPV